MISWIPSLIPKKYKEQFAHFAPGRGPDVLAQRNTSCSAATELPSDS